MSAATPHIRPALMVELPPVADIEGAVAWCIEEEQYLILDRLVLVPDMLRLEWAANDWVLPDTIACENGEGRTVYAYVVVEGLAYGVRPADGD